MSCKYCEEECDLFAGAEGMGCAIESIRIEGVCFMSDKVGEPPKSQARIFAEIGNGEAWTKPINFCPMCGARLTGGDNR